MLDFTSALYLGLRHASTELAPWPALTSGVPAALSAPPEAREVASAIELLTGVERATVARSTLHAVFDVFSPRGEPCRLYVDGAAYPIAHWGAERAAGRGVLVRRFPHHDVDMLWRQLRQDAARPGVPWVVTDGYCTGCDRLAPLADYAGLVAAAGGRVVVDDTQALGVLGARPTAFMPYGHGGGGSLRRVGATTGLLLIASLAKAFGAPMAVIGGPADVIARLERNSDARVHASPPSMADLRAAGRALAINDARGDALRRRLAALVAQFRDAVRSIGHSPGDSLFPIQWLASAVGRRAHVLYARLRRLGVAAVLRRSPCRPVEQVAFVITAAHSPSDIEQLVGRVRLATARTA